MLRTVFVLLCCFGFVDWDKQVTAQTVDVELNWLMLTDPQPVLPPPRNEFPPQLKSLWLSALQRDDTDLQRQAADTITRAHRLGMADLEESAETLLVILDAEAQHPVVRRAAANALVQLDVSAAAPRFVKYMNSGDVGLSQITEPALARWQSDAAQRVWIERIQNTSLSATKLRLACQCLSAVQCRDATPQLIELVKSKDQKSSVRLAAARALGSLENSGLDAVVEEYTTAGLPPSILDRLAMVSMLKQHEGAAAEDLLLKFAVDPEPSVQAIALERLLELSPERIVPLLEVLMGSADAKVRQAAAQTLFIAGDMGAVQRLGLFLDDRHPDVRNMARRMLEKLAQRPELEQLVHEQMWKMLQADGWQGLEQAIVLVVTFRKMEAAGRVVDLLDFDRPEVFITAAWALRELAWPEVLDGMLAKAETLIEGTFSDSPMDDNMGRQAAYLFEAFGKMKFTPAEGVMRRCIPKTQRLTDDSRATAIWALGHLYVDEPSQPFSAQLIGRITDLDSDNPEALVVQEMSAVTLGRMNETSSLTSLREFSSGDSDTETGFRYQWAIAKLSGEPMVEPKPVVKIHSNWFIRPID